MGKVKCFAFCILNVVKGMIINMKNEIYGIIGLGRFGEALAKSLTADGKEIIVLDNSPEKINEAAEYTENAFLIDKLSKENLKKVGIQNCDTVVVCIGELVDKSILTTLNVIELGVKRVIAKATSEEQGSVLEKLGAEVVYPEKDMAERVAKKLCGSNVLEYIYLNDEIGVSEIKLSEKINGETVEKLNIRKKFGLNIIALEHNKDITIEITPDLILGSDDILTVVGRKENIEKFEKYFS